MKPQQFRQGDVLLERVESAPQRTKEVKRDKGRVVLAYGEVTGHAHAIHAQDVTLREAEDGTVFLCVETDDAVLSHEEHAAVPVERGTYKVTTQREYTPEAIRNVAD